MFPILASTNKKQQHIFAGLKNVAKKLLAEEDTII